MGGGLLQLVSRGPQDIYFNGNPQITFFKLTYRKHTRFSVYTTENFFSSELNFGSRSSMIVPKRGDLLSNIFLKVTLPKLEAINGRKVGWVKKIGYAIINNIEVLIGGRLIDRQYGMWMYVWNELTRNYNHDSGLDVLLGNIPELTTLSNSIPEYELYIPLKFWFCNNAGSSFPLISLDKHKVVINVSLNNSNNLINYTGNERPYIKNIIKSSLIIDYVYLDMEERRKFASQEHEYLIEQLQFMGEERMSQQYMFFNLGFNKPIKEMFWMIRNGNFITNQPFLYFNINEDDNTNLYKACNSLVAGICDLNIDGSPNWSLKENNNTRVIWNDSGSKYINQEFFKNSSEIKNILVNVEFDSSVTEENKNNGFSINNNVALIVSRINKIKILVKNDSIEVLSIEHNMSIQDISYPVNLWVYDNRNNYSKLNDIHYNDPLNFSLLLNNKKNPVAYTSLTLNGTERIDEFPGDYFNYYHPEKYHTNTPADGINVFSFGIYPEKHQPSGSCDMSYINTSKLNVWLNDNFIINNDKTSIFVFALNYNLLKIMEGFANISYK